MAGHRSFRDPVTGVLKSHGFVDANEPGDLVRDELDDFSLVPGLWRWIGTDWVPNVSVPTQRQLDRTALLAVLADAATDVTVPAKLRAVLAALAKVI